MLSLVENGHTPPEGELLTYGTSARSCATIAGSYGEEWLRAHRNRQAEHGRLLVDFAVAAQPASETKCRVRVRNCVASRSIDSLNSASVG